MIKHAMAPRPLPPACFRHTMPHRKGAGCSGLYVRQAKTGTRHALACGKQSAVIVALRRHKLETSLSQLTYALDKGDYAGSVAVDSRGAAMLTATRCSDAAQVVGTHRSV